MLAHLHSKQLNASELSRSLGVSGPTIGKYVDLLSGSFIIHRLQPYFVNVGKRLVKSPKIYIRDSGLLHALLNIKSWDTLFGHIGIGASWEGYVIEQIRRSTPTVEQYFYYRTHAGAEIDLFTILPNGKKMAIEIKNSNAPKISKGFYQSCLDLNPDFKFVVTPEGEAYPKKEEIWVVGLSHFLTHLLPDILD